MQEMNYQQLRTRYPIFLVHRPRWQLTATELLIHFDFEIPGLASFAPRLSFPLSATSQAAGLPPEWIERLARDLALIEMISYWKCCCPPEVQLEGWQLSSDEAAWWYQVYRHGLGEFFYRNGITPEEPPLRFSNLFDAKLDAKPEPPPAIPSGLAFDRVLVPVGGGKDSAVTLERLALLPRRRLAFAINATQAALATMERAGIPPEDRILVRRHFDPALIDLNRRGFLNGHTPFSALVAFIAELAALLHGCAYVALSNEASASDATVAGSQVNHQWSKSYAFESLYREHQARSYPWPIEYFSLLRPFSELAIAREFGRHPQYHDVFLSCNLGGRANRWCGNCGKCLFVALILLPFLGPEQVKALIAPDILERQELQDAFDGLVGLKDTKPWECVGTVAEVNYALELAAKKYGWLEPEARPPALIRRWLRARTAGSLPSSSASLHPFRLQATEDHIPAAFRPAIANFLADGAAAFPDSEALLP
ncbi:MAG: hypothetical protein QM296_06100 [Bacillota bacterium]|nr:hypothetical protein [Bacillota bacterium]